MKTLLYSLMPKALAILLFSTLHLMGQATAVVTTLTPTAYVEDANGKRPIEAGGPIIPECTITTQPDSSVTLTFGNGDTLVISEGTTTTLRALNPVAPNQMTLDLISGSIEVFANSVMNYTVLTPDSDTPTLVKAGESKKVTVVASTPSPSLLSTPALPNDPTQLLEPSGPAS